MLAAIALLLGCQLAGEIVGRASGIAVPGPVIGLLLLLLVLAARRRERPALEQTSSWLIAHLSIMFVPAAVGIIQERALLARYGWAIMVATCVSTLLTLVVTALVFRAAAGREEARP